jgi:hypothetical protein
MWCWLCTCAHLIAVHDIVILKSMEGMVKTHAAFEEGKARYQKSKAGYAEIVSSIQETKARSSDTIARSTHQKAPIVAPKKSLV